MTSTIPAAMLSLIAGFASALPDAATVIDGTPWDPPTDDFLCVGWTGSEDENGVTVLVRPADAGLGSSFEAYDVANLLTVFLDDDPDSDDPPSAAGVRAKVFAYFDLCAGWLTEHADLGIGAGSALVTDLALSTSQRESGSVAVLRFTVHIEAWSSE